MRSDRYDTSPIHSAEQRSLYCPHVIAALLGLFSGGYAGSRLLDSRKQRLIDKDYRVSGPAGFMVKDLRFATDAATATNTATPQLNMLSQLFTSLVDAGLGDDDLSVLHKHIASLPRS